MKLAPTSLAFFCAALLLSPAAVTRPAAAPPARPPQPDGDKFVYADFEAADGKRPVSRRGGLVQLVSYQETTPARFKGLPDATPPAPELVRLKPDDPNRAAAFDYELYSPNQYAGVGVEVNGQPQKDGRPAADDLSAYKYISMQVYATGVPTLRLELISRGQGINLPSGFPQSSFKIRPGFNTYRIALGSLTQPQWAVERVSPKDVLRKLTAVGVTAYCERCTPVKGTVVIDNIVFEK
jgi:hypothetical protein